MKKAVKNWRNMKKKKKQNLQIFFKLIIKQWQYKKRIWLKRISSAQPEEQSS
jgi:hypothetical protein